MVGQCCPIRRITAEVVDLQGACELRGVTFLGFWGRGAGAGAWVLRILYERRTWGISYTASWPSLYTVLPTVVFTRPVVTFTWVPFPITFRGNSAEFSPASVCRGLLTVWNCGTVKKECTIWNFVRASFCWSMNEFSVPVLRSEKALSVGANMVNPGFVFFWSPLLT